MTTLAHELLCDITKSLTDTYLPCSCPLGSWVSLWNFKTIRGSLKWPKWPKLAILIQKICTLKFQLFDAFFASKGYPFKKILLYLPSTTFFMRAPARELLVTFLHLRYGAAVGFEPTTFVPKAGPGCNKLAIGAVNIYKKISKFQNYYSPAIMISYWHGRGSKMKRK